MISSTAIIDGDRVVCTTLHKHDNHGDPVAIQEQVSGGLSGVQPTILCLEFNFSTYVLIHWFAVKHNSQSIQSSQR